METAVASVLNKVLSDWLEDLSSEKLKLSIWSGTIRLNNIKVKPEAFDKFGLPFQVRYGYVGTISVDIEWLHLASRPLKITIQDVFLFLGTRPSANWSEEIELKNLQAKKNSDLQQFEIVNSEVLTETTEPGFLEKLITKIVDNVQINISGVYLRLEDQEASTQPFAFGLILGKVEANTCNAQWVKQFVEGSPVTNKLVMAEDVSAFLDSGPRVLLSSLYPKTAMADAFQSLAKAEISQSNFAAHNYLLAPATSEMKIIIRKDHENFTKAMIDASLKIGVNGAIQLGLDMPQMTHALKLVEFYAMFNQFRAGILAQVVTKKWTEVESESYRSAYKKWFHDKDNSSFSNELAEKERGHLYEEIASVRLFALKEMKIEAKEADIQRQIEESKAAPSGILSGVKGLFGWGESTSAAEERKQKLAHAETHLVQLRATKQQQMAEFMESGGEVPALQKEPDSYVKIAVQVSMPMFKLKVVTGGKKLVTLEQESLNVGVALRGAGVGVEVTINWIQVKDKVAKVQKFPNIINSGLIKFKFVQHPNNLTELAFQAEQMLVILNLPCFSAILEALYFSIAAQFDLNYYQQMAGKKVAAYVIAGQHYIEDLIKSGNRRRVVIDIAVQAPCAIIPLNILEPVECLVVDLGKVTVKTELSNVERDNFDFSSVTDESLIYDFYRVHVKDAKIGVLWDFLRVDKWRDGAFSPLFEPSTLSIDVGACVVGNKSRYPWLLGHYKIDMLNFFISDRQLLFLLKMKDRVMEQFEEVAGKMGSKGEKSEQDKEEGVVNAEEKIQKAVGLSQYFDLTVGKLLFRVEQQGIPLIEASISDIAAYMTMSSSGSLLLDFQVRETVISDRRSGAAFLSVLSKPYIGLVSSFEIGLDPQYWYHDQKVAAGGRIETGAQLYARVKIPSGEEVFEVLVSLCNLRLTITSDLAISLLHLPLDAMRAAGEDKAHRKAVKELSPLRLLSKGLSYKLKAERQSEREMEWVTRAHNVLITVLVQDVEMWVPESSFDSEVKIASVYVDSTMRYTSCRVITEYKNWKGEIVRAETVDIDEEANVEINKIGVVCGFLRENHVVRSTEEKEDILNPSRVDVEYSCVKSDGPQKMTVELSFEALDVVMGFRDIVFLKGLYQQWVRLRPLLETQAGHPSLQRAQSHYESPALRQASQPLQSDELHIRMKLNNLKTTVVDDTSEHLLQLFFLNLMNVSSTFIFSDDIFNANFSSGVKLNYFNAIAACWEPLIEEWVVEVDAKQPDLHTPLEIFIQSSSLLNINLSYLMGETVSHVLHKLNESASMWVKESAGVDQDSSLMTGDQVVYRLKNRLGTGVRAWIEGSQNDKRDIWTIPTGKFHKFGQHQIDKVRRGDSATGRWKYASLLLAAQTASSIAVEIETVGVISNIIVDELVTKSFVVREELKGESTTIVVDISVRKGERVISLESVTKVLNNTQVAVEISHRGRKVEVRAGRGFALPLNWMMAEYPTILSTQDGTVDLLKTNGIIDLSDNERIAIDSTLILSGAVDEHGSITIPHQKIIILNTPFTVHNLTPGVLSLCKENESEPVCSIAPGEMQPLMIGDFTKRVRHKWVVQLDGVKKVETEFGVWKKEVEQRKVVGDIPADKLTVEFAPMSFVKSPNFDLSFKPLSDELWHGSVIQVYFPFLIVNRTPFSLEFQAKGRFITFPPRSIGTVKDQKSQMSVRVSEEEFGSASDWSKPFNMRTVGIAGSVQMNMAEGKGPTVVELGVKLENAAWPLVRTVIVKVQPRFIVGNYLDFSIFVRQAKMRKVIELPSGEAAPYQLEDAKTGRGVEISVDMENWSSPFNIENIDDLQVRFRNKFAAEQPSLPSPPSTTPDLYQFWYRPSAENNFFHFVRVIIATEDEATLFISFTNPIDPEYMIANMTNSEVTACQVDCRVVTKVRAKSRAHFAYDNHFAENKKLRFQLEDESVVYGIDSLKESKRRLKGNKVRIVAEGATRVVFIEPDVEVDEASLVESMQSEHLGSQPRFGNIKTRVRFSGCVVSLIDDQPSERFVFSLTGLDLKVFQKTELKCLSYTVSQGIKLHVMNIQLDDMQAKGPHFPVILGQFTVVQEPGEDKVPFFQFRLEKNSTRAVEGEQSLGSVEHVKHVGLLMQPVQLQVHQETVMGLLGVTTRLQNTFVRKDVKWKADTLNSINFLEVCPSLDASYPTLHYSASQISAKAYFQFVNLNAMKFVVSFRSSSKKTTLKIDPREAFGVVSILSTVGRSFINISDSPLHFSNIILLHSFQTIQAMTWTIAKNYIRQGALQFYKIIGSSDMIGNPIGLIDKLGTGVFEFFNEPRKGLLKGPKEFATGLGKGVKSLVSGVVSGGFGSVSRITGSLYSVVRQVGGDENSYERINRSDTATQGIYHGLQGGVQDLAEGVAGLFTKPYRGAKVGGVTGFFKGVGSGLIGVVTAPLSAVLRVGTSVTSGIANSATFLRTGKIQQKGRIRFPRPFGARKILEPYNEELAQAQEFLRTLKTHMDEQLVFYLRLDERTIVIITTKSALEIVDADVNATVRLKDIDVCQVHWVQKKYVLVVGAGKGRLAMRSKDFAGVARLFGVFTMNAGKIDDKKKVAEKVEVSRRRDRCC